MGSVEGQHRFRLVGDVRMLQMYLKFDGNVCLYGFKASCHVHISTSSRCLS